MLVVCQCFLNCWYYDNHSLALLSRYGHLAQRMISFRLSGIVETCVRDLEGGTIPCSCLCRLHTI